MSTHYVFWYSKLFLSKMPHFVILWEARVFFRFFNFVKNAQFCHFLRGHCIFFSIFQFFSKMVHFVIFETRTSNYEISIKEYYVYTMCCDISNYFCQKCPILSFCERLVYFFASSVLSKMLNFVILWEDRGFFSLLQFCQKCSILSFWERTVNLFTFSILSKMLNFVIFWEGRVFFSHFDIVKNAHFVIFEKRTSNYEISISILWVHTMCSDIANYFCQKCPILSFCERLVYFFASSNFVKNAQFCHFLRRPCIFSLLQFCQKCLILSFSERGKCIFFTFSILSKMVHFVIFETWTSNYEISISIPCVQYVLWYIKLFCQKCSILSFPERPGPCIFSLLQACQKCLSLSFSERPLHLFQFFNFMSKMVHFVIFATWSSNYEISIKEYYVYTMCCDISNYFVKNA